MVIIDARAVNAVHLNVLNLRRGDLFCVGAAYFLLAWNNFSDWHGFKSMSYAENKWILVSLSIWAEHTFYLI